MSRLIETNQRLKAICPDLTRSKQTAERKLWQERQANHQIILDQLRAFLEVVDLKTVFKNLPTIGIPPYFTIDYWGQGQMFNHPLVKHASLEFMAHRLEELKSDQAVIFYIDETLKFQIHNPNRTDVAKPRRLNFFKSIEIDILFDQIALRYPLRLYVDENMLPAYSGIKIVFTKDGVMINDHWPLDLENLNQGKLLEILEEIIFPQSKELTSELKSPGLSYLNSLP